jgi:mannose-6-phosphate isomerase-like protein (cupin superfamily)
MGYAMTGEPLILGPGEGRRFWTSLANGAVKVESGAADFSVFESSPPPGLPGPAPHVHHRYDEAWFVVEGTMEFLLGDRLERGAAGAFVLVPRGVRHSFANPGPDRARMLVIGSAPVQGMVEEIGRLSEAGQLTTETLAEVYQAYDSELR